MSNPVVVENAKSRILGIGIGTFTVGLLAIFTILIWIFSTGCTKFSKWSIRWLSTIIFVVIFMLLVFAERDSQYKKSGTVVMDYDHSASARIGVTVFMIISTIFALFAFCGIYCLDVIK
eukprot:gene13332-28244_t